MLKAQQSVKNHRYCSAQFIPQVDRIRGAPVVEKGRIAPHEGDGEPLEQPLDGGALLLPSVPRQEAYYVTLICYILSKVVRFPCS